MVAQKLTAIKGDQQIRRLTGVSLGDGDFRVVVPFPLDGGLRRAISAACQRDVGALSHDNVARAQRIVDGRRHCKQNVQ